jgi:hypothetical protein
MRREARKQEDLAKDQLIQTIQETLVRHGGAPDYLARTVEDLTEQGVTTLTGKKWTRRNLWGFMLTNEDRFPAIRRAQKLTQGLQPAKRKMDVPVVAEGLRSLAERYGWIPVAVADPELLERVEQKLQYGDCSISQLIEDLLREWLEGQD